jgi:hypothetical protein
MRFFISAILDLETDNYSDMKKRKLLVLLLLIVVLAVSGIAYFLFKGLQSKFEAPRENTPDIQFTISKNKTLDAIVGDLKYYGFIKDERAFTFALEHTQDNTKGGENFIKVGKGSKTIEREAVYTISQSMTAWELASTLLNEGIHQDCDHGCPESDFIPELLPGGDLAPTIGENIPGSKHMRIVLKPKDSSRLSNIMRKQAIPENVLPLMLGNSPRDKKAGIRR